MKILFNVFPPLSCYIPDTGMSVLKTYLIDSGHQCKVIYWNHLLRDITSRYMDINAVNDLQCILLPYLYLLNPTAFSMNYATKMLMNRLPILQIKSQRFREQIIEDIASEINLKFDEYLLSKGVDSYSVIGITYKFNQWIPGIHFLKKVRAINKHAKFVIGGIPTKEEAKTILKLFSGVLDFAIWGEGEYSLQKLMHKIETKNTFYEDIPSLVYHTNGEIIVSHARFVPEKMSTPDYEDYFEHSPNLADNSDNSLYIEGARGCAWRRCKFCYLNEGYVFRKRSIDDIIQDIRYLSTKYKVNNFSFTDNDFLCADTVRSNDLLDKLIEYRNCENNNIEYNIIEVNTFYLSNELLNKASLAGIKSIQIGFESLSSSLLHKMNKQSSFIHHLLGIKLAHQHNIKVDGANILKGIQTENTTDILESIDNLHLLRFAISEGLKMTIFPVTICKSSKYYNQIKNKGKLEYWVSEYDELVPEQIFDEKFILFSHYCEAENYQWKYLSNSIRFYESNKFTYELVMDSKKHCRYIEYFNDNVINTIDLYEDEIAILEICNKEIVSIEKVRNRIKKNVVTDVIDKLIKAGIIFHENRINSIFSVINLSGNND